MYSPNLPEFLKLATQGNVVPVTRRLLADIETPLSAYRKIRGPGEAFLFESVEGGEHLGRYSFVGCNPRSIIRQQRESIQVLENGKNVRGFINRSSSKPSRDKPCQHKPASQCLEQSSSSQGRSGGCRTNHEAIPSGRCAWLASIHWRRGRIHRL